MLKAILLDRAEAVKNPVGTTMATFACSFMDFMMC